MDFLASSRGWMMGALAAIGLFLALRARYHRRAYRRQREARKLGTPARASSDTQRGPGPGDNPGQEPP
jgi:hypothetical protein